jgi:hypothetical protein
VRSWLQVVRWHANSGDIPFQIVLNPSSYPNFLRFLKQEGIDVVPTEMTFSVSRDQGRLEWAGGNLITFFCQPARVFDPRAWRLLYDILRFNTCARRLIEGSNLDAKLSIGEYLERENYSDAFRDDYLIVCIYPLIPSHCSRYVYLAHDCCRLEYVTRQMFTGISSMYTGALGGCSAQSQVLKRYH